MKAARGFSLLEVVIALAIVAIGVLAAVRTISLASSGADDLKNRQLADWVAQNHLAEWRVSGLVPEAGSRQGQVSQGRQVFVWREEIRATDNPLFHRVDLLVFAEGGQRVLARLSGLIMAPGQ